MRISGTITILLIAGASATAGALAQQPVSPAETDTATVIVTDLFTSLVKLVGTSDTISRATAVTKEHSAPDAIRGDLPQGALDFLTSAYGENDYYDSGYWEKEETNSLTPPYTGKLPDYVINDFRPPVRGIVTSRFGIRPESQHIHKGVDISLHKGDTVRAALNGTVEHVGYQKGGYGYFVIVAHPDGVQTRYAHLQKHIVTPGTELKAGDAVAIGGTSGNSTGPHLHFEIRCHGRPADPLPLLKKDTPKYRH